MPWSGASRDGSLELVTTPSLHSKPERPLTHMAVDTDPGLTSPQRYSCRLPGVTERTPAEVRRLLRVLLSAPAFAPIVDDVLFVATELLTNVWKHTDGRCHLTVLTGPRGVHIHVRDYSTDLPVQVIAEDDEESGRGVVAVDRCATGFQVTKIPDGKIVTVILAVGAVPAAAGDGQRDDGR
ncbi:ATP-binding protein [Streptomyces sparsogenes]|uniref:ATP-binding protein n=1 Tax=Streptomyces sparsogenes TaxID=67365 RepID=UPI00332B8E45